MKIKTPFYIKAWPKDKKKDKYNRKTRLNEPYFFPFDGNTQIDLTDFELCTLYRNLDVPFNGDSLVIPNGIELIENNCFEDCRNLKEIKFPNSLEAIGNGAFRNCSSLEKIIIPMGVYIGDHTFVDCSGLKELYLPRMNNTFTIFIEDCPNIEKLTLNTATCEYPSYLIMNCRNTLEQINVEYTSFEDLVEFIENYYGKDFIIYAIFGKVINERFDYSEIFNKYNVNLEGAKKILNFEGPELSKEEKEKIKKIFGKKIFELITFTPKIILSKYSKDIQQSVNKLFETSEKLPNDVKNKVLRNIFQLLNQYDKDLKLLKPRFDDDIKLDFGPGNIISIKADLLSKIELMELKISQEENLITFLNKLDEYKKVLNEEEIPFDELNQDDLSTENMLRMIRSASTILNEEEYIKNLNGKINNIIREGNEVLNSIFDKTTKTSDIAQENNFDLFVSNMCNDILFRVNSIKPIKDLYDELSNEGKIEFTEESDIISLLQSIKYVISSFESEKYKQKMMDYFNEICIKYRKIIENILNNNNAEYTDINLIEKSLRENLQPLLVIMNRFANIEKAGIYKITNEGILEQLEKSQSIIEGEVTDFEKYKKLPITSYVIDIINIIKYSSLEEKEVMEIKSKLLKVIKTHIKDIKNKKISEFDEYNDLLHIVMKDIADIYLKTDFQDFRLKDFNNHVK